MSMPKIGGLDSMIISSSVQPAVNSQVSARKENLNNSKPKISKNMTVLTGAVALAAIVTGGILITRGRKSKEIVKAVGNTVDNTVSNTISNREQKETGQKIFTLINFDEISLIKDAEKDLRAEISKLFKVFRDKGWHTDKFEWRVKEVVIPDNPHIEPDVRELDDESFETVMNLIKSRFRAGVNCPDAEELERIDALIDDAPALQDNITVFFGLRTQKTWDNFSPMNFVKDLKEGNMFKDENHLITSRVYDDFLAQCDPVYYEGHRDCGYIVRASLPQGTKGLDCRRLSGEDFSAGANALFVLPKNSQFEIMHIDNNTRIIDVKYVLPQN